jgi:hypothetical protein
MTLLFPAQGPMVTGPLMWPKLFHLAEMPGWRSMKGEEEELEKGY